MNACTHLASCAHCQEGLVTADPMGFVVAAQWHASHMNDTLERLVLALATATGQSVAWVLNAYGIQGVGVNL